MKTITFYGASDDLVEVHSTQEGEGDEYPTDAATFTLTDEVGRGYAIEVAYVNEGVWAIAVRPMDDTHYAPQHWKMRMYQGDAIVGLRVPIYSMALVVECDESAFLDLVDA